MATVQTYVDRAKFRSGVDSDQITDANVLVFFNKIMHELENAVCVQLREMFYRGDLLLVNLVAGQNDYQLPVGTSTSTPVVPELKKLLAVYVKYSTATNAEYFKAHQEDMSGLAMDLPFYGANQSPTTPFFILKGTKIQIFPTPSVAVSSGLKIDYERSEQDVTLATDESALTLPWQYHDVIVEGVTYMIHQARQKVTEQNNQYQFYLQQKKRLLQELADRFSKPEEGQLPALTSYMY